MIKVGVAAPGINLGALVKVRKHRFHRKMVAVIVVTSLLSWLILATSGVLSILPMILLGMMFAHCIELQHQCLHHTAYRSKKWNRFIGVLLGLPSLVSFSDFQYSHMRHHRNLGTPQDKEFFDHDYKSLRSVWQFLPLLFLVPYHKALVHSLFDVLRGKLSQSRRKPESHQKNSHGIPAHGADDRGYGDTECRLSDVDLRETVVHPVPVLDTYTRFGRTT